MGVVDLGDTRGVELEHHAPSFVGLLILCSMLIGQRYVVGLRSHRDVLATTDQRSVPFPAFSMDALTTFVITAVIAIHVGVGSLLLANLVWVQLLIRAIQLIVWAKRKQLDEPTTVIEMVDAIASGATIVLIAVTAWHAVL